MRISFNALAERELNEVAQFYERDMEYPEAARVVLGSIRRRLLRRFPYAVLYRLYGDSVRILAVMNLKRRPVYWIGRL